MTCEQMSQLVLLLLTILVLLSPSRTGSIDIIRKNAKVSFEEKVKAVYRKVSPCLQLTSTFNNQQMAYNDDLEEHYKEILAVTGQYRQLKPHSGSGNYQGEVCEIKNGL